MNATNEHDGNIMRRIAHLLTLEVLAGCPGPFLRLCCAARNCCGWRRHRAALRNDRSAGGGIEKLMVPARDADLPQARASRW